MILRGAQFYRDDPMRPLPVAERIVTRYWPIGVPFAMPEGFSERETYAYVNHSRWVADCPWCGSAVVADPSDPRLFCIHCLNNATGKWCHVHWPENIEGIEEELMLRPNPRHRNTEIGDTAESLRAERREREQLNAMLADSLEAQGGLPVLDVKTGKRSTLKGPPARKVLKK